MLTTGKWKGVFPADNVIGTTTASDARGDTNFATTYQDEGGALCRQTMEAIRREVERVDALQGFQVAHGLGGGTGSGLSSALYFALKQECVAAAAPLSATLCG